MWFYGMDPNHNITRASKKTTYLNSGQNFFFSSLQPSRKVSRSKAFFPESWPAWQHNYATQKQQGTNIHRVNDESEWGKEKYKKVLKQIPYKATG